MSTFDDASLVFIPSGYKTSKAYSVKPIDGSGDLTFTRSNDTATRVNSAGLIEKVRTNLVPNGLLFNGATGVLYTTVTSDSPISGVSSTRITKNEAAGTLRYGNQSVSASVLTGSISYTISRYFKYDGYNLTTSMEYNSSLNWGGTSWVQDIDIASTGVTLQAPSNCTSKITNVGNGWYRVDVTIVNGASPIGNPTHLLKLASTLSTGQGFLTAAPQLETGDIATSYIATTSAAVSVGPVANVPRLDYLNSSCPRLLLEPQRQNLALFSESFNNAGWTKENATITANAVTSPSGYQDADTLTDNSTNGRHRLSQIMSATNGTTYTYSVFVKKNSSGRFLIINAATLINARAALNLDTLAITNLNGTGKVEDYGNGWYRFSVTGTATATSSTSTYIQMQDSASDVNYVGNGSSFYLWGAQLEAGAYATSYIPTLGAAVTRGADACSKTGISSLIGQTEGTLFADITLTSRSNFSYFAIAPNLGSTSAYIGIGIASSAISFEVVNSGVQVAYNFPSTSTGRLKLAFAYKANDFVAYVNGALVHTDTSGTVPTCSEIGLNAFNNTASWNYNQALLFKTRLSNSDLAALTTL